MNTPMMRLGVVGLVMALAGLAAALWLQRRQEDVRRLETRVRAELEANQQKREALRRVRTKAPPPPVRAIASPVVEELPRPATNFAKGNRLAVELRGQPDYVPYYRRFLRRETLRQYGGLLAELKLPPEREAIFKQRLDDRLGVALDLNDLAYRQGFAQGSPEYTKLAQQHYGAAQGAVQDVLTPEERVVFQRYELCAHWRTHRQLELDEFMADRGLPPLQAPQQQALTAAYHEAFKWKPAAAAGALTPAALQRRRSEQLVRLATAALDSGQRAALSAYLDFNDTRSDVMGRLYYPEKPPGSVVMTVSVQRP